MRKALGILGLGLILAMGAFSAQADTSTPTFTCPPTSCSDVVTASDVTFPSPSILESWDIVTDFVGLAAADKPTDTYTWENDIMQDGITPELADYFLSITDVTTGDVEGTIGTIGIDPLFFMGVQDSGTLTFSTSSGSGSGGSNGNNPTPEPSTVGLVLAGIGALIAMRKFWA